MEPSSNGSRNCDIDPNQVAHDALTKTVNTQGVKSSTFRNGVSVHRFSESLSFANVNDQLRVISESESKLFVGCIGQAIVVSLNFNYTLPVTNVPTPKQLVGKKRRIDPQEEAVQMAVERVRKGLLENSGISERMLENAQAALVALLKNVSGSNGEPAIESWGLNAKQPDRSDPNHANETKNAHLNTLPKIAPPMRQRPCLILSARLSPGIAVSLNSLKRALGTACFRDGMFTILDPNTFANGFQLPLSDHAQVAEAAGQRSIMLLATVSEV